VGSQSFADFTLSLALDSDPDGLESALAFTRDRIMEWKLFATVFASIFIAELADKTQMVTLLFAADRAVSKWVVFAGSASALVVASAIGVLAGSLLSQFINVKVMSIVAGAGFMLIGAWTLYQGMKLA